MYPGGILGAAGEFGPVEEQPHEDLLGRVVGVLLVVEQAVADSPYTLAKPLYKRYERGTIGTLAGSLGESQGTSRQSAPWPELVAGSVRKPRPKRWRIGLAVAAGIAVVAIAILTSRLMVPLPPPKVSSYVQVTNDGRAKSFGDSAYPLVTDGSRLYFVEFPFDVLTQVSTLGGETSTIAMPFPLNRIGDISPDR